MYIFVTHGGKQFLFNEDIGDKKINNEDYERILEDGKNGVFYNVKNIQGETFEDIFERYEPDEEVMSVPDIEQEFKPVGGNIDNTSNNKERIDNLEKQILSMQSILLENTLSNFNKEMQIR